jgi:hypothetical protein
MRMQPAMEFEEMPDALYGVSANLLYGFGRFNLQKVGEGSR